MNTFRIILLVLTYIGLFLGIIALFFIEELPYEEAYFDVIVSIVLMLPYLVFLHLVGKHLK